MEGDRERDKERNGRLGELTKRGGDILQIEEKRMCTGEMKRKN